MPRYYLGRNYKIPFLPDSTTKQEPQVFGVNACVGCSNVGKYNKKHVRFAFVGMCWTQHHLFPRMFTEMAQNYQEMHPHAPQPVNKAWLWLVDTMKEYEAIAQEREQTNQKANRSVSARPIPVCKQRHHPMGAGSNGAVRHHGAAVCIPAIRSGASPFRYRLSAKDEEVNPFVFALWVLWV